jgi:hypothetical protein
MDNHLIKIGAILRNRKELKVHPLNDQNILVVTLSTLRISASLRSPSKTTPCVIIFHRISFLNMDVLDTQSVYYRVFLVPHSLFWDITLQSSVDRFLSHICQLIIHAFNSTEYNI